MNGYILRPGVALVYYYNNIIIIIYLSAVVNLSIRKNQNRSHLKLYIVQYLHNRTRKMNYWSSRRSIKRRTKNRGREKDPLSSHLRIYFQRCHLVDKQTTGWEGYRNRGLRRVFQSWNTGESLSKSIKPMVFPKMVKNWRTAQPVNSGGNILSHAFFDILQSYIGRSIVFCTNKKHPGVKCKFGFIKSINHHTRCQV